MAHMQRTILKPVTAMGIGLHSGKPVRLTIHPGAVNTGIVFWRSDIGDNSRISATWENITDSHLSTTLSNDSGVRVSTVEHILAALNGLEIDNVVVELTGQEVPVMDGSAHDFIALIDNVGVVEQGEPRKILQILKEVAVSDDNRSVSLKPGTTFSVSCEIEFEHPCIGKQTDNIVVTPDSFRENIAGARTFGFFKNLEAFHAEGYALGATGDNTLVFGDDSVMNVGGLRYPNEPVRHKMLDAIGDLYLVGARLVCTYVGIRSSHSLHAELLRKVFSDQSAYVLRSE